MFDVLPQLRDQHSSHITSNGVRTGPLNSFAPALYIMPVSVNDKRQEWLRKNAPHPKSLKSVKTGSKLRVVMDTGNEHFGQFYKIHAMASHLHTHTAVFSY
jgi:hypothetical protein